MGQVSLTQKLWTVELPKYAETSGGIVRTKKLTVELQKKHKVHLRIQKTNPLLDYSKIDFKVPYSIGMPDKTFPESDVVITYSDNPYADILTSLPQVKRTLIYMLSYGMCFERERKNIFNPKITVMSSTNRTKKMIEKEGIKCYCVGFGLETKNFYIDRLIERKKYAALLYHYSLDKQYELGVKVCNELYKQKLIDGTITFGTSQEYQNYMHPISLIKNYQNASSEQVKNIFNECCIFIMPSITEGLNSTPVESTLCGCPSIICDGAIDDLFFDGETCLIARKNDFIDVLEKSKKIILHPIYSMIFKDNLEKLLYQFTWEKTILNIEEILRE
jgi:hypothetical protein